MGLSKQVASNGLVSSFALTPKVFNLKTLEVLDY